MLGRGETASSSDTAMQKEMSGVLVSYTLMEKALQGTGGKKKMLKRGRRQAIIEKIHDLIWATKT